MSQMKVVLSSLQLPLNASMDNVARAYHATETYVQVWKMSSSMALLIIIILYINISDLSGNILCKKSYKKAHGE
jgi:hypothetical protein